ncbi:MAG TPA: alpha/beta fold hydrolase [Thermoanaerobaculia bacterium]|jgi:predicted alpha/beta hydrolase
MPEVITLRTDDDYPLEATLYEGGEHAIVIAGAMGVPRRYYDAFARAAVEHGYRVLTFDYRGVGGSRPPSLRGFRGTLTEWGCLDLTAAIERIRATNPKSITLFGHSVGGQIAGLASNADAVSRIVFVASQSGYWRLWPHVRGIGLGLLWLLMPPITHAVGFFPSKLLGLGSENLPRFVAAQWAMWGKHPDYVFGYHDRAMAAALDVPLLAWSFADDHYAPKRAVEKLLTYYSSAKVEHRHVAARGIAHFGFFRRQLAGDLWEETFAWLTSHDRDRPL